MRRRCMVVLGLGLLVSACASAREAAPAIRTVEVPVPLPCRPELDPEPDWPDTDQALRSAPDLFTRVKLLTAGRLLRSARERELNAALKACGG